MIALLKLSATDAKKARVASGGTQLYRLSTCQSNVLQSIREGDEDMFANGGFVRRNSAAKKRKKEATPAREEPEPQPMHAPPVRTRTNTAPAASTSYVYEPPNYPPVPGNTRAAAAKTSTALASTSQPPPKRARVAPPAPVVNKKYYRSPVLDHPPSSSPAGAETGKQAQKQDYGGKPPELTPNMSSSPDIPGSSPISSSPPPSVSRPPDAGSAEREPAAEYHTKSGLMDMVINNSAKKRKVSGGAGSSRLGALGNGSPVMKRKPEVRCA